MQPAAEPQVLLDLQELLEPPEPPALLEPLEPLDLQVPLALVEAQLEPQVQADSRALPALAVQEPLEPLDLQVPLALVEAQSEPQVPLDSQVPQDLEAAEPPEPLDYLVQQVLQALEISYWPQIPLQVQPFILFLFQQLVLIPQFLLTIQIYDIFHQREQSLQIQLP